MDDTPETVTGISEYYGQIYYFCSPTCKGSFDKEPEKYLGTERDNQNQAPYPDGLSKSAILLISNWYANKEG